MDWGPSDVQSALDARGIPMEVGDDGNFRRRYQYGREAQDAGLAPADAQSWLIFLRDFSRMGYTAETASNPNPGGRNRDRVTLPRLADFRQLPAAQREFLLKWSAPSVQFQLDWLRPPPQPTTQPTPGGSAGPGGSPPASSGPGVSDAAPQPSPAETAVQTATERRASGDTQGALDAARRASELAPRDPRAGIEHSLDALLAGKSDEAQDEAKRVLDLKPPDDLADKARSLLGLSRRPLSGADAARLARGSLDGPISTDAPTAPESPPDLVLVASAAPRAGRNPALDASWKALRKIEAALGRGDPAQALRQSQAALKSDPENARLLALQAAAKARLKDYAGALADARKAAALSGNKSVPALLEQSWILAKLRRFGEALDAARSALRADPRSARARLLEARALAGLKKRLEALEALRRAAELEPFYRALYERAKSLPLDGDIDALFEAELSPRGGEPPAPEGRPWWPLAFLGGAGLLAWGLRRAAEGPGELADWARGSIAGSSHGSGRMLGDGYRIEGLAASSELGELHRALRLSTAEPVAIRVLREELQTAPADVEELLAAARPLVGFAHPAALRVQAVFLEDGKVHVVSEPPPGEALSRRLAAGALPLEQALGAARELAAALDAAHAQRILHGDVRPANVYLAGRGVKLADFALAAAARRIALRHSWNERFGEAAWLAPETELASCFRETDVFGLGATLHGMLTGRPPSAADVPGLPPGMRAALRRALSARPQERFHSAGEFVAELERAAIDA